MRHPNYLAVVVELLAALVIFGAWRTATAIATLNLCALWIRIRAEEDALPGATAGPR
jgi:methyltransferase